VITQLGLSIPDDASWETLPEVMAGNKNWEYLNSRISLKKSKNTYAQFPNQCEISVNLNLLEKEMARTGGSNYGDYYLDRNFNARGTSAPDSFSEQLYLSNLTKNQT
jgi:hypothetical protein